MQVYSMMLLLSLRSSRPSRKPLLVASLLAWPHLGTNFGRVGYGFFWLTVVESLGRVDRHTSVVGCFRWKGVTGRGTGGGG